MGIFVILVMGVIIISMLGISISSFINNTTLRDNFSYLWQGVTWLWGNYILGALKSVWNSARQ